MDRVITDSHPRVTISHSKIMAPGGTPSPRKLSYFGMRVGYERKSALGALRHARPFGGEECRKDPSHTRPDPA